VTHDARQFAPAAERNRDAILDVLRRVLPERGLVLEIAAGTGQHASYFAAHLPHLRWQPSDPDAASRVSIAAWRTHAGGPNLEEPVHLDVCEEPWPVRSAAAVVNINMIHISPWSATEALMRGAAGVLEPGGVLFLYGPYRVGGQHTAPSNEAFDLSLRSRNPEWGVRDLEAVVAEAERWGLRFEERVAMPANNQSVVFTLR
jgi:SAM-dependent methyltransferase